MDSSVVIESPASPPLTSSVRDYITLLKPGVMSLVVFTAYAGLVIAPGTLHPFLQFVTVLCIAVGSGAGAAINMWFDRDIDALMLRTVTRPLPAGRIVPAEALAFGIALAGASVMVMGLALNWVAAGILAFAIAFYAVIYTMWLKRSTPQNIVIGGAAGAFPPMIGWAAVTGDISLTSLILFLIIFLWTPPHFWALALYRNSDYARANIPMMPVVAGRTATKRQMLLYTLLLYGVSLAPSWMGEQGVIYGLSAALLGAIFLFYAIKVQREDGDHTPKRMFAFSIFYLFALFAALIVDKLLLG